jgi:hypothetical protein
MRLENDCAYVNLNELLQLLDGYNKQYVHGLLYPHRVYSEVYISEALKQPIPYISATKLHMTDKIIDYTTVKIKEK